MSATANAGSSPVVTVRFPDGSEASFRRGSRTGLAVSVTLPADQFFTDCEVTVGPDGKVSGFFAWMPHGQGSATLRLGRDGEVVKHTWEHGDRPLAPSAEEEKAVKAALADARRKARDARAAVRQAATGRPAQATTE